MCDATNAIFEAAIAEGRLSNNEYAPHYSGNYMFMGFDDQGIAMFKHSCTRHYLADGVVEDNTSDWQALHEEESAWRKQNYHDEQHHFAHVEAYVLAPYF